MNMWEVGCQNPTDRTDQEQTEFSGMWVPTATVRSDVTDDLIEVVTVVSDSHRRLGHLLRSPPACTKIPEIVSRKFMATVSRSPAVPLEVIQPFAVTKRLVNGLWFRLHYVHSVKNSCCQKSVLTSRTQIELRNCIASLQLIIVQTSAFTQHLHPNRSGCWYLPLCRCLSHRSQRGGKHVGFLGKVWLIVSKMWFTMLQPICPQFLYCISKTFPFPICTGAWNLTLWEWHTAVHRTVRGHGLNRNLLVRYQVGSYEQLPGPSRLRRIDLEIPEYASWHDDYVEIQSR